MACRTSNGMLLHVPGALDSDPDHSGSVFGAPGYSELRVSQDGTTIADQADTDYLTAAGPEGESHVPSQVQPGPEKGRIHYLNPAGHRLCISFVGNI